MPHKKNPNMIQVYAEVTTHNHNTLKEIKTKTSLSLYKIVGMAIVWAITDPNFIPWLLNYQYPEQYPPRP